MLLTLATVLTGCAKYYYGHPERFRLGFEEDSRACIREVGIPSGGGQHALVTRETYQPCMEARGWRREKKVEPVELGWYRGVEGDEVVSLTDGIRQPEPTSNTSDSDVLCRGRAANAGGSAAWLPAYRRCMEGY